MTVTISAYLIAGVAAIFFGVMLFKAKKRGWGLLLIGIGIFLLLGTVYGQKVYHAILGGLHGAQRGWDRG